MSVRFELYGWRQMPLDAAQQLVGDALGIDFTLHSSSYVGEYYLSKDATGRRISIQENRQDDEGYYIEEDHREFTTLVYVSHSTDEIATVLRGLEDIETLRSRET